MDKKKLDQKHNEILQELLKQPDNKVCCDCPEKGPRWASWNIGCFLCVNCAGIHRRLGTHISKVKSVNLDSWTPEQIESIRTKGNNHVNSIYDPHPNTHPHPSVNDDAALEQFIRDKYERKLFMNMPASSKTSSSHSDSSRGVYSKELSKLRDMGFDNEEVNVQALKKSGGDVNGAVSIIIRSQPEPKSNEIVTKEKLSALYSMGFKDERQNTEVLKKTNGDVNQSVSLLVKQTVAAAQSHTTHAPTQQPNLFDNDPFTSSNDAHHVSSAPTISKPPQAQTQTQTHTNSQPPKKPVDIFGGDDIFSEPKQTTTSSTGLEPDLFSPESNKPKATKNDILSLYSGSSGQSAGFGGAPAGGFGGAPAGGFGGAPAGGFGGAPAGGFGGAPVGGYGYGAPASGYGGAPVGGYGAPVGGFGAPVGGYGAPAGGFGGAPAGGYGAPAGGYGAPAGGYGAPAGGYGAPAGGYGAPAGGFGGAPAGGYGGGYGAPSGGATNPGNPFGTPAAGNPFASNPSSNTNPFGGSQNKNQFQW